MPVSHGHKSAFLKMHTVDIAAVRPTNSRYGGDPK
jgi:hypothetical protein